MKEPNIKETYIRNLDSDFSISSPQELTDLTYQGKLEKTSEISKEIRDFRAVCPSPSPRPGMYQNTQILNQMLSKSALPEQQIVRSNQTLKTW